MHLSTAASIFREGQIIYLQHQTLRLYAETIQVIQPRKLCWARPLALIQPLDPESNFSPPFVLHDLRQDSDLLLPISLFHIALDVDALPVLTQLDAPKSECSETAAISPSYPQGVASSYPQGVAAHQLAPSILQNFVSQIWQAYPEQFSNQSAP
jgi:hypothetical protein